MLTNLRIFWVLTGFFLAASITYIIWASVVDGRIEWAGTVAMVLSAALSGFIAFYLTISHKAQGGELPEDRLDADIDDGDSELGHYSPWSWWPIFLAGALALTFLGLAVGTWLSFIGVPLVVVGLVGWVFEYYRGNFAR